MLRTVGCVGLMGVLLSSVGCAVRESLDTGDLLAEMTNLHRLIERPEPGYRTVQFSSYDRRSSKPGGPGWFSNSDGFGGEILPGFEAVLVPPNEQGVGEYLICDVPGPGVIVRTWTAAIDGAIRLYLDDMYTPVYDGPAAAFLECPYRALAAEGAAHPALLEGTFRQHQAAYCPIPFAGRCRMVWVGDLRNVHFYHVQIRLYERGRWVRTFQPEDLTRHAEMLRATARLLADPEPLDGPHAGETPAPIRVTLAARAQEEVLKIAGPRAVQRLTLRVAAEDVEQALRQTILNIHCDGHPWGQVQAPLGDFFGAAPGVNPYTSLPFTVRPDGTMTCRFVMPFAEELRIVLDNRGTQEVTVTGTAWSRPYAWNERSLHFRARWRVNHGLLATSRAVQDLPLLLAYGGGRYVGSAVMLLNPARVPTPHGGWWGEGDEKIFVDEDVVPSTFGTGSEDYFNYAWSVPDVFAHAYCGQPRNDGPGNRGFVTNHRWHILDDLPFRERFAFYLELYPHDHVPEMSYARIGYYYAEPGTMDDHVVITDEDLRRLALPEAWEPAAAFGMHGAVFHAVEDLVAADAPVICEAGPLWAGGELAAWQPGEVGEQLALRFAVADEGKYVLHLACALDATSGRVRALLNEAELPFSHQGVLDLFEPHRVLARQFTSAEVELAAGAHVLTLVFEGAPETVVTPRIGLDFLALQPR